MKRHGVTAETLPAASRATQERVLWEARQECASHGSTVEELAAYFNICPTVISRRTNKKKT